MPSSEAVYFSGGVLFNSLGKFSIARLKRSDDNTAPCAVALTGRVTLSHCTFRTHVVALYEFFVRGLFLLSSLG